MIKRKSTLYLLIIFSIFGLVITGCANKEKKLAAEIEKLERENQELRQQNEDLVNLNKQYEDEISRYIEAQELRNSMDILARKIIEALYNRDIDNLKAYLCDNAIIDEEKIVFQIDDSQNEAEYLSREEVRLDKLRQRYYYMDKDEKYITGYEIIDPKFENTFVMVLTFVNKNGEWQLFDLGNDV